MVIGAARRRHRILVWLLTGIGIAAIYAPPLYLLAVSFNPALQPGLPSPANLSLRWYRELADERGLLAALSQSAVIALITGVLATSLSLLAALAYVEMGRHRSRWFLAVVLPMFVPGVIQGLALSVIFRRMGIKPSTITVAAGHLLWAMPFAFIVLLTSLSAVRRSYLMAAADLGASWSRQLRDITLPLIRPGLISAFVFCVLLSLNEFSRAYYLVGRQNTLPITLFGIMNSGASPTIYALSGAIFLVSILAVVLIAITIRPGKHETSGRSRSRPDPA